MTDGAFGALPAKGFVLNWLYLPVWRFAWIAQDELASLEQAQFTTERERPGSNQRLGGAGWHQGRT